MPLNQFNMSNPLPKFNTLLNQFNTFNKLLPFKLFNKHPFKLFNNKLPLEEKAELNMFPMKNLLSSTNKFKVLNMSQEKEELLITTPSNIKLNTFPKFSKINTLNTSQLKESKKELNIKLLKDKSSNNQSFNNNQFNMFNKLPPFNMFNKLLPFNMFNKLLQFNMFNNLLLQFNISNNLLLQFSMSTKELTKVIHLC